VPIASGGDGKMGLARAAGVRELNIRQIVHDRGRNRSPFDQFGELIPIEALFPEGTKAVD
jgi:hypothetical protein